MTLEIKTDDSRGAQRVINYVGAIGPAALVSLDGGLLLWSHAEVRKLLEDGAAEVVVDCHRWRHDLSARRVACLPLASTCVYYARVSSSVALFVIVNCKVGPAAVAERLQAALAVFDRVRVTRARGGSPGAPASAQVSVALPSPRGREQ